MDIKEKLFYKLHDTAKQIACMETTNDTEEEIKQMAYNDINELIDKYRPVEVW